VTLEDRSARLDPGGRCLAQLRLDSPLFAFAGDRFILRSASEQETLAGGIVLDADASRRGFHAPARAAYLRPRAQEPANPTAFVRSQLARDGHLHRADLLRQTRFGRDETEDSVSTLLEAGTAIADGDLLLDAASWSVLAAKATDAVTSHQRRNPEQPGLDLSELKAVLAAELADPELFELLVRDLCRRGFVRSGTWIRGATHRPSLPAHLIAAGNRVREALAATPLDPPSKKVLAPDAVSEQALRFLVRTGEAIELNVDCVLAADAFERARDQIFGLLRRTGRATASELRQELHSSRRIVIPLLELLDRHGITRREGDYRVLR
jgi:selenocysteine-specific elongation factor